MIKDIECKQKILKINNIQIKINKYTGLNNSSILVTEFELFFNSYIQKLLQFLTTNLKIAI